MRALHENAIVGDGGPVPSRRLRTPLVEPLRITLETLDLEAITKLWTAASQPMRLSVGYEVSLVVVDAPGRPRGRAAGEARVGSGSRRAWARGSRSVDAAPRVATATT